MPQVVLAVPAAAELFGRAEAHLRCRADTARVIDYTAQDFTKDDQEYDVVFDAVGKSSFGRCRRLLKPGGIYLSTEGVSCS